MISYASDNVCNGIVGGVVANGTVKVIKDEEGLIEPFIKTENRNENMVEYRHQNDSA